MTGWGFRRRGTPCLPASAAGSHPRWRRGRAGPAARGRSPPPRRQSGPRLAAAVGPGGPPLPSPPATGPFQVTTEGVQPPVATKHADWATWVGGRPPPPRCKQMGLGVGFVPRLSPTPSPPPCGHLTAVRISCSRNASTLFTLSTDPVCSRRALLCNGSFILNGEERREEEGGRREERNKS